MQELIANSPIPGTVAPITTLATDVVTSPAVGTQETWTFAASPPAELCVAGGQFRFICEQEILLDITAATGTARTVLRGQEGSTVSTHSAGAQVFHDLTAGALTAKFASAGTLALLSAGASEFPGWAFFLPSNADLTGSEVANNSGNASWIDSSGRTIIGGELSISGKRSVAVCRLLATGLLDTSFGTNGWFTLVQSGGDYLQGMAIQSDGKILVSGWFASSQAFVLRLTTDGVLDTTFNASGPIPGVATFQPNGTTGAAVAFGVCQDSGGKVVASGKALRTSDGLPVTYFTRFNANGTVDTAFGTSGSVLVLGPSGGSLAWNVIADSQGRYVAGGQGAVTHSTTVATGSGSQNQAGQNQLVVTAVGSLPDGLQPGLGIAVDSGANQESVTISSIAGSVLTLTGNLAHTHAAGVAVTGTNNTLFIARVTSTGVADATFNGTGWNQLFSGFSIDGLTVAQQSTGSYIVGGQRVQSNFSQQAAVARFKPDGTLDTSFGSSGLTVWSAIGLVNALVVQPDDRILVGPGSRLLPNGQLDLSFGRGGVQAGTTAGASAWWATNGCAITPDQSTIVMAGRGIPAGGVMSFSVQLLDYWGNPKAEGVPLAPFTVDPALPAAPANGSAAASGVAYRARETWCQVVGDGATTSFTVPHALGTQYISVEGYPDAGGKPAGAKIILAVAANPVDLQGSALVSFSTAPATGTKVHLKVIA